MPARPQVPSLPKFNRKSVMVMIRPTVSTDAPNLAASSTPLFYAAAGWLAIAAGTLLVIGQAIWWPFDQQGNVATSQNNIFKLSASLPASRFTKAKRSKATGNKLMAPVLRLMSTARA
jgi:hypothetical protein